MDKHQTDYWLTATNNYSVLTGRLCCPIDFPNTYREYKKRDKGVVMSHEYPTTYLTQEHVKSLEKWYYFTDVTPTYAVTLK